MKKPLLLIALLFVSSIAAASIPPVQEIQAGNWTGTITEDESFDIVYEVETEGGLAITIRFTEMDMVLQASDPKLEGTILTFDLTVGSNEISCALERRDDGSFHGECADPYDEFVYLVMNPPQGLQ